ncbi:MAG TPA: zinc ribbon domain-containing protein [Candidatus Eisenbergiella pullistercoris]|uniref:Zinc ribbon domain-containing protein n=1 Tax=Candidatus Eisenbergiella pullistercoris TaxID=2838555 RepID=A0A9D1YR60_9FIRM|nr:zinc ribbon domain-containing protein [Candidatus Eisenbergiella pullistercoris]
MYCRNCGAELSEGAKFCSRCGTRVQQPSGGTVTKEDVTAAVGKILQASRQAGSELRQKLEEAYGEKTIQKPDAAGESRQEINQQKTVQADTGTVHMDPEGRDAVGTDTENRSSSRMDSEQMNPGWSNTDHTEAGSKKVGQVDTGDTNTAQAETGQPTGQTADRTQEKAGNGSFSKVWNHPVFTMIAVKFGNLLDILISVVGIWLGSRLLSEGGISGTLLGIVCLAGGICGIVRGIRNFLPGNKEPETAESLNKKKRNLCIGVAVILFALFVTGRTGGGIYSRVQSISFDDYGPETIGEIVDRNISGADWSQERLDSDTKLVTVEGYCPMYAQDIRITFRYEDMGSSYGASLQSIMFPDSGDTSSDPISTAIIWATFYE